MSEPENRTKTGQFLPGQSGNPGGRPRNPLAELIRTKTKDGSILVTKALKLLNSKNEKSVAWACEFLRDSAGWKPAQSLRQVDEDGADIIPAIQFVPFKADKKRSGHKGL